MNKKALKEALKTSCARTALTIVRPIANLGDKLNGVHSAKNILTKQEIEATVDQILADAGWNNLLNTLKTISEKELNHDD